MEAGQSESNHGINEPSDAASRPRRTVLRQVLDPAAGHKVVLLSDNISSGSVYADAILYVRVPDATSASDTVIDKLTGKIGCVECKPSPTASLTPKQKLAFPEIGERGGTIVGVGKPGFSGGMQIPPTDVQIIQGP